jgi:hypothetical protein
MAYQSVSLEDYAKAQGPLPSQFIGVVDQLPPLSKKGPWIAGGSVRKFIGNIYNDADYDIFFSSQEQMNNWILMLEDCGGVHTQSNIFNKTYTLNGNTIQCIHHEFRNTLIQTMDRFDITICQFGFDGTHLVWSDEASEDVREGKLRFLSTTDPIYNINRAFKYASQGFVPRDGEVKKVLSRVAKAPESLKNNRKISGAGTNNTISLDIDPAFMLNDGSGAAFIGNSITYNYGSTIRTDIMGSNVAQFHKV